MSALIGSILVIAILVFGFTSMTRPPMSAGVYVDSPPIIMESEPSDVVLMSDTGVYYVPGVSYDVFFYNGYWWSPRGNNWYRTDLYNGSWGLVQHNDVPAHLFAVPKNYRAVYQNAQHINYRQWTNQNHGNQNQVHARSARRRLTKIRLIRVRLVRPWLTRTRPGTKIHGLQ